MTENLELTITNICDKRIDKFFTSTPHKILFTAVIVCAGYIFVSLTSDIKKATNSINNLQTSIAILNSSLAVIDERTRENEKEIREQALELMKKNRK